jgi:uncharacterized protein YjbI with pentapeptide repeats
MKTQIVLLLLGAIVITSVSTTNVFAQDSGNISILHSIAKLTSCFEAPTQKIDWSNCKMIHTEIHFTDLTGANLSGTVVKNALFYDVNLSGANLQNSDLSEGNFAYSKLSGADLRGADLRNIDFYHANLSGADLRGTNLLGAKLSGVNFSNAKLSGLDLFIYHHDRRKSF